MHQEKCKTCLCSTCFGCIKDNQCARCMDNEIVTRCEEYCEERYSTNLKGVTVMKNFNLTLTERQIDIIRSAMGVAESEGLEPTDSNEYRELEKLFALSGFDLNRDCYWRNING